MQHQYINNWDMVLSNIIFTSLTQGGINPYNFFLEMTSWNELVTDLPEWFCPCIALSVLGTSIAEAVADDMSCTELFPIDLPSGRA